MFIESSAISCGVDSLVDLDELSNRSPIQEARRAIRDDRVSEVLPAFFLFSDKYNSQGPKSPGQKLADQIKKGGFGTLFETTTELNRNSGNRIRVWVWKVPRSERGWRGNGTISAKIPPAERRDRDSMWDDYL